MGGVRAAGAGEMRRRSKYGNRKTVVDGITFDSAKEARRYVELRLLEKAGEIRKLRPHPVFDLCVAVRSPMTGTWEPVKIGRFTPDFEYYEHGARTVEDVKSEPTRRTDAYRLRKRMFEAQYGIELQEV